MFKNALVSCSNKEGLVEFLKPLQASGLRIVSTGGTASLLKAGGVRVIDVSEQTGFPEIMDGRVKTLHPKIHMALLAREEHPGDQKTLSEYEVAPFDLVVGNLYPFDEEPTVENIDIGGPSFLRAAAKNYSRITVVCDPKDYEWILEKKSLSEKERKHLAAKLFFHTSSYDAMIGHHFFSEDNTGLIFKQKHQALGGELIQQLRYGENPDQKASWYRIRGVKKGLHQAKILQGKELSYNNILDLHAAVSCLTSWQQKTVCVAVKHGNPCGVACNADSELALEQALQADPQSVFGGIVAINATVTKKMAEILNSLFLECVVAPSFAIGALDTLKAKKNLRILEWPEIADCQTFNYRSVLGGFLVQEVDRVADRWQENWKVYGSANLNESIKFDLVFARQVCAFLKSNAIAIASAQTTLGLGMGQVNRIDAVAQAIDRSERFHPQATNRVLASDAFFPFADSIEKIAQAGIRYVIQPGGSVKDGEVIQAAEKLGLTLVLTGQRHFLH